MAKVLLEVQVTPSHVINGAPGAARKCPVALAIKDTLRSCGYNTSNIGVSHSFCRYDPTGHQSRLEVFSPEIKEFIRNFDTDEPLGPLPRFFIQV